MRRRRSCGSGDCSIVHAAALRFGSVSVIGIVGYTLAAIGLLFICVGLFVLMQRLLSDEIDQNLLGPIAVVIIGAVTLAPGLWIVLSVMPG